MEAFNYISKLLKGLNYETALLEACDWDETRSQVVTDCLIAALADISSASPDTKINVIVSIADSLSENLSDRELSVCMDIIKSSIESLSVESIGAIEYEN